MVPLEVLNALGNGGEVDVSPAQRDELSRNTTATPTKPFLPSSIADTDSRLAITGAVRKVFAESPGEFDPRAYLAPARTAMQAVVAERMRQFGQAGHFRDYEPKPLEEMQLVYANSSA